MSFMDRIKSFFSGGSDEAGVRPAAEPDAATADDGFEPAAPPLPPTDPVGMPTGEPQPPEPQADEDEPTPA